SGIFHFLGGSFVIGSGVKFRVGGHCQDFAVTRVHDDDTTAHRAIFGDGILQLRLGQVLDTAINGQHDVLACRGNIARIDLEGNLAVGLDTHLPGQQIVAGPFDTHIAAARVAIAAHEAVDLLVHAALRVDALGDRLGDDAQVAQPGNLLRHFAGDRPGQEDIDLVVVDGVKNVSRVV